MSSAAPATTTEEQGPPSAPRAGGDGPSLSLAPEHQAPVPSKAAVISVGAGRAPDEELVRGLVAQRFRSASESLTRTSIGGYGEVHVKGTEVGDQDREWGADVARFVLFVAHEYNDSFRFYSELEVEHSMACKTCGGAVELEQAYLDWKLVGDRLGLRAGLVVVPMGIINQWHEPPIFHGVVRPRLDTVIIPSTWREIGIGAVGQPVDWLRYELYAMTGLDPGGIGARGLGGGKQNGALSRANAWAVVGRAEVEPLLGFVAGAAGYASDAGANAELFDSAGEEIEPSVPVLGWAVDARWRRSGLEAKVEYAEWRLPEAASLMRAFDASGAALGSPTEPVPTAMRGVLIEAAYDVLRPFDLGHQLLPFARFEAYDTQAAVPEGFAPNGAHNLRDYTFGLSYRPIQEIVVKADYQIRDRQLGADERLINFGAGFMF